MKKTELKQLIRESIEEIIGANYPSWAAPDQTTTQDVPVKRIMGLLGQITLRKISISRSFNSENRQQLNQDLKELDRLLADASSEIKRML
jgi:hypothetical protein